MVSFRILKISGEFACIKFLFFVDKRTCLKKILDSFSSLFDFSLLKNPLFLLIGFANTVAMLGFYVPFIYLPAAATNKVGFFYNQPRPIQIRFYQGSSVSSFLISTIGMASTIGRIVSGIIGGIEGINVLWLSNFCVALIGLVLMLVPISESGAAFVTIALTFGLSSGKTMN